MRRSDMSKWRTDVPDNDRTVIISTGDGQYRTAHYYQNLGWIGSGTSYKHVDKWHEIPGEDDAEYHAPESVKP